MEGHFGVKCTRLRARDSVFWPGINKDIETLIKSCESCQEHSRRNPKDPIIPREIPLVAWTVLEMDIFTCDDQTFLLVVDVTSRFPVVRFLSNETTRSVLNTLKGVYCGFSLPRRVLSDNGPCFRSQEFIEFDSKLAISVEKSSVYNHCSVGSVERMVQTIKQIMTKTVENAWLAMLIYRSTDIPGVNKSPNELLNNRKYRTYLPIIDKHERSNEKELEKMSVEHLSRPTSGKELPRLPVGTEILYEENQDSSKIKRPKWRKGTIKQRSNPRKYTILSDNDRVITHSRHHIKGYFTRSGSSAKLQTELLKIKGIFEKNVI